MIYAAYGMNLDPVGMDGSYPGARKIGPAWLPDFRLEFREFADIVMAPGRGLWVGLWELDAEASLAMDYREGYPTLYGKRIVTCQAGSEEVEAVVYHMQPETRVQLDGRAPSPHYMRMVVNGYEYFGLPLDFLARAMDDYGTTPLETYITPRKEVQ